MLVLAITGGIATGKSTFCRMLQEIEGERLALFDSDRCVHGLLTRAEVVRNVADAFGPEIADADGQLNRALLREHVFRNPAGRRLLEGILHPLVRAACAEALAQASVRPQVSCFAADVPLLYESQFPLSRDVDVVVACSSRIQRERLSARNGFDDQLMDQILAAQLPILDKVERADCVVWNGGSLQSLRQQTEYFLTWLKTRPRK